MSSASPDDIYIHEGEWCPKLHTQLPWYLKWEITGRSEDDRKSFSWHFWHPHKRARRRLTVQLPEPLCGNKEAKGEKPCYLPHNTSTWLGSHFPLNPGLNPDDPHMYTKLTPAPTPDDKPSELVLLCEIWTLVAAATQVKQFQLICDRLGRIKRSQGCGKWRVECHIHCVKR